MQRERERQEGEPRIARLVTSLLWGRESSEWHGWLTSVCGFVVPAARHATPKSICRRTRQVSLGQQLCCVSFRRCALYLCFFVWLLPTHHVNSGNGGHSDAVCSWVDTFDGVAGSIHMLKFEPLFMNSKSKAYVRTGIQHGCSLSLSGVATQTPLSAEMPNSGRKGK